MNLKLKIIKSILVSLIVILSSCENKTNNASKAQQEKNTIKARDEVLKISKTKKKLFLEFWSGMSKEEFEIIKNIQIEKSNLFLPMIANDNKLSIRIYLEGNPNGFSPEFDYYFKNNQLISITLRFDYFNTDLIRSASAKYYPGYMLSDFGETDKRELIKLYEKKYGTYSLNKYTVPKNSYMRDGKRVRTIVAGRGPNLVELNTYHETYTFSDRQNQKKIEISISRGEKYNYSETKILDTFYSYCKIRYISNSDYFNEKAEEREKERINRKKREEKRREKENRKQKALDNL